MIVLRSRNQKTEGGKERCETVRPMHDGISYSTIRQLIDNGY